MGKFRQILMELSAGDTPIFSIPDDNLSKCQGILTKLGTVQLRWFFKIPPEPVGSGFDGKD